MLLKKIVSVNSAGNCTPVVVMGLEQQLMGLEQQPEGGLCFWKPCFAYCYED